MVTNEFENFNNELNRSNWYQFPIDIQQVLIIVISNAQQSMTIRGMMLCTRESFKEVNVFNVHEKDISDVTIKFGIYREIENGIILHGKYRKISKGFLRCKILI